MDQLWQLFNWIVTHPYFSYGCMLLILVSVIFTRGIYKLIPIIMLGEFALTKLCYIVGRVETAALHEHKLYIAYACCGVVAIALMQKYKLSLIVATLIFINTIYNLLATLAYFFYYEFISFYKVLPQFVGTIMILETLFCLLMWPYVEFNLRKYGIIGGYTHMRSNFFLRSSLPGRDSCGAVS